MDEAASSEGVALWARPVDSPSLQRPSCESGQCVL